MQQERGSETTDMLKEIETKDMQQERARDYRHAIENDQRLQACYRR